MIIKPEFPQTKNSQGNNQGVFAKTERYHAKASQNGIELIDLETNKILADLEGHQDKSYFSNDIVSVPPSWIQFIDENKFVSYGSASIKVYDIPSLMCIETIRTSYSDYYLPIGGNIIVLGYGDGVEAWDFSESTAKKIPLEEIYSSEDKDRDQISDFYNGFLPEKQYYTYYKGSIVVKKMNTHEIVKSIKLPADCNEPDFGQLQGDYNLLVGMYHDPDMLYSIDLLSGACERADPEAYEENPLITRHAYTCELSFFWDMVDLGNGLFATVPKENTGAETYVHIWDLNQGLRIANISVDCGGAENVEKISDNEIVVTSYSEKSTWNFLTGERIDIDEEAKGDRQDEALFESEDYQALIKALALYEYSKLADLMNSLPKETKFKLVSSGFDAWNKFVVYMKNRGVKSLTVFDIVYYYIEQARNGSQRKEKAHHIDGFNTAIPALLRQGFQTSYQDILGTLFTSKLIAYDDDDIMKNVILYNPFYISYSSERIRSNKDLISRAFLNGRLHLNDDEAPDPFQAQTDVYTYTQIYLSLSDTLKTDLDFNTQVLAKYPYLYEHISASLKDNLEIIKITLQNDGQQLKNMEDTVKADLSFCKIAVESDAQAYQHIDKSLSDNSVLAITAVRDIPSNIQYVSDKIKYGSEIIETAINAFVELKNRPKEDSPAHGVFLGTVHSNNMPVNLSGLLDYSKIPSELFEKESFVENCVQLDFETAGYIPSALWDQDRFFEKLVELEPCVMRHVSADRLRQLDDSFIRNVVLTNVQAYPYVPNELKEDKEYALRVFDNMFLVREKSLANFNDFSLKVLRDSDFINTVLDKNIGYIGLFPDSIKGDSSVAEILLARPDCEKIYSQLSEELRQNKDILNRILNKLVSDVKGERVTDLGIWYYVPETLKNDRDFVVDCFKRKVCRYSYVGESLKNDDEIVRMALAQEGVSILGSVPEHYRDDKELMLSAIELSKAIQQSKNYQLGLLKHLSVRLQDDKEVALAFLSCDAGNIHSVSERLRADIDIGKLLVERSGPNFFHLLRGEAKNNLEIIHTVLKSFSNFIFKSIDTIVPDQLMNDSEILEILSNEQYDPHNAALFKRVVSVNQSGDELEAIKLIRKNWALLAFFSDGLRDSSEIVKISLTGNGRMFKYASKRLQADPETVKLAIQRERGGASMLVNAQYDKNFPLFYASESLRSNKAFILQVLNEHDKANQYSWRDFSGFYSSLSDTLKSDEEVLLLLFEKADQDSINKIFNEQLPEEVRNNVALYEKLNQKCTANTPIFSSRFGSSSGFSFGQGGGMFGSSTGFGSGPSFGSSTNTGENTNVDESSATPFNFGGK